MAAYGDQAEHQGRVEGPGWGSVLACDRGQDSSPQWHLQLELPDGRELLGAKRRAHGGAGDAVAGCWALREPLPLHMGSEQTSQAVPNSLDWDLISLQGFDFVVSEPMSGCVAGSTAAATSDGSGRLGTGGSPVSGHSGPP